MKRLILFALILILISGCNNQNNVDIKIAKCISEKSVIYISTGCLACNKQRELFGENFEYLNVVNCATEPEKCGEVKIIAVPTWIIDGEKYKGVQKIEKLRELTNCG